MITAINTKATTTTTIPTVAPIGNPFADTTAFGAVVGFVSTDELAVVEKVVTEEGVGNGVLEVGVSTGCEDVDGESEGVGCGVGEADELGEGVGCGVGCGVGGVG